MRIALVMPAPTMGGVYSHVRVLAIGLAERGHDVTVFADVSLVDRLRLDLEASAVSIGLIDESPTAACDVWHLHLHDSFGTRSLVLHARRVIRRGTRTIILDEHLPRTARSDASLEWDPHLPPGRKKPFARQAKSLLKWLQFLMARRVVVHSEASRRFLECRYAMNTSKVVVVPLGVREPPELAPLPPSDALRVLVLAVVSARKGQDVLIEATRFARTSWEVTMVGDGPQVVEFKALAATRALQPVTFSGATEDGLAAIAACDVLCVPSRSDASSISGIEAMMAGRPVVGSDVDGVPELIVDGETGLVGPPDDPEAHASALDSLADPNIRAAMGARARTVARVRYSIDRMVAQTLAIYEEVARHG